ncbi:DUF1349 domain-containing protein [Caulobacter radicis]|uniref:DUF1349 domain-containing protein n=1 Tax=Caulobacter radicis TaxID=2172650 RepID=UPI001403583E|nr:DUF1349 domain-containing protein [Caulobacter radicis]
MSDRLIHRRGVLAGAAAVVATPALARAADGWSWLNTPDTWAWKGDALACDARAGTDFWRRTAGGPLIDNGHFWFRRQSGDFEMTAVLAGDYAADADQTGLMLRLGPDLWMKTGVERLGGELHSATVFTRDWSDGSSLVIPTAPSVRVKLRRSGQTLFCAHAVGEGAFVDTRLGHLPMPDAVDLGVMAASPAGKGFAARISNITIKSL